MEPLYDYDHQLFNGTNATVLNGTGGHDDGAFGYDGYIPHGDYAYYGDYEYESFIMETYDFERPLNICIIFLVFLTTIFNIFIMLVLLKRSMRTPTNIILVAIAVSDSLTGLVFTPAYIYVYSMPHKGYVEFPKSLCDFFMLSKFFASRYFHTVSVWLTLFLGFQRFICVRFPFKAKDLFTMKRTLIIIAIVYLLAPILHLYHALDEKKNYGMCAWVPERPCKETCAYLWLEALLMHILPGVLLIVFTVFMLSGLAKSKRRTSKPNAMLERKNSDAGSKVKDVENRRLSMIVVTLVIVFLIPEIPYGIYLVLNAVYSLADEKLLPLRTNRIFHSVYEILLLLTFHANFWIYTVMNKRFRAGMAEHIKPLKKFVYRKTGREVSTTQAGSSTEGRTLDSEVNTSVLGTEMRPIGT